MLAGRVAAYYRGDHSKAYWRPGNLLQVERHDCKESLGRKFESVDPQTRARWIVVTCQEWLIFIPQQTRHAFEISRGEFIHLDISYKAPYLNWPISFAASKSRTLRRPSCSITLSKVWLCFSLTNTIARSNSDW